MGSSINIAVKKHALCGEELCWKVRLKEEVPLKGVLVPKNCSLIIDVIWHQESLWVLQTWWELCFVAFQIVPLIYRSVQLLGEWSFNHFIISIITIALTLASSAKSDGNLWTDLIVELVLLLTSTSPAMSKNKFSTDLVVVVLSIEVSGLTLLKLWIKRQ